MSHSENKDKSFSRRGFLPLLCSGLLIPLVGFGKKTGTSIEDPSEEHQILLKPDGTTVRVRKSVVKNSEVVKKNISNQSLFDWLKNIK